MLDRSRLVCTPTQTGEARIVSEPQTTGHPAVSTMPAQMPTVRATTRPAPQRVGDAVVEQWDFLEITLKGPSTGNPFVDVEFGARFTSEDGARHIDVPGFYDGDGTYRVRFMPPAPGRWEYTTRSNVAAL